MMRIKTKVFDPIVKSTSLVRIFFFLVFILIFGGLSIVGAQYVGFTNYQTQPDFQTYYSTKDIKSYWPILDERDSECRGRQDIILNVAPGGCQPMVVRSDLLADQNVPVLCQIDALQVNPLIDIKQIKNVRFSGTYPKEVAAVGFHPARAALNTRDVLLGSPLINNIGYVVVVLKRNQIEKDLPDFVNVTLSAQLDYESGNVLGIGSAEFALSPIDDADWEKEEKRAKQSFWNGRYYVRLNEVDENFAYISIYDGDRVISSTKVKRGELSSNIYFPGSYCMASVQAEYSGFEAARDSVRLKVTDDRGTDTIEVYSGTRFYDDKCRVSKIEIDKDNPDIGKITLSCAGKSITLERNPAKDETLQDENIPSTSKSAFNSAIAAYEIVADDFPAERIKDVENDFIFVYYGEQALDEAIRLARNFRQFAKEKELLEKTISLYPNSKNINEYRKKISELSVYDLTYATEIITINNRAVTIQLSDFKKVEEKDKASATFSSGQFGKIGDITVKEDDSEKAGGVYRSIKLLRVLPDGADTEITCNIDGKISTIRKSFKEGDTEEVCGNLIKLKKVNLDRVARIRLIPKASYTQTETNLTVTIGIEKRSIKLSPEKRKEMVQNINGSIEKWEKISDRLGKVVTGLKGACFVTSAALMVKNFISGVGGNTLARQQAMEGWTDKCKDDVSAGKYSTMTRCYSANNKLISEEIRDRAATIKSVNERVANAEEGYTQSSFLGTRSVDSNNAKVAYYNSLSQAKKDSLSHHGITLSNLNSGAMSYTDLRDLDYYLSLQEKHGEAFANKEITDITNRVVKAEKAIADAKNAESVWGVSATPVGIAAQQQPARGTVLSVTEIKNGTAKISGKDVKVSDIPEGSDAAMTVHGVREINGVPTANDYVVIGKRSGNQLEPRAIYSYNPPTLSLTKVDKYTNNLIQFNLDYQISTFVDGGQALSGNRITDTRSRQVIFFGSGPDKGLAQRVPFDLIDGWYALVESSLDVGKNIKSYDSSGMPRSWYICNAGINRLVEDRRGDDECQLYIEGTGSIPILGLSDSVSRDLISKSRRALREANNQANNKVIKISGVTESLISGVPKSVFSGTECQQFMSVSDCNILFNVCDPVICPTSRCDLGGNFPVSNVAQTGIIGSTVLCLPNFGNPAKGGVLIPVCLTGIQAGVDAWVSILKNHRDCLQESLDSGRMTGICDEIYSFYTCDMFWKNIGPFANNILPALIQRAYSGGQGARGGAEYLAVQTAWDNMDQSINYFTQSYASNSFNLFQARSVAELGTEICRGYISGKGPTDFKSMIEPDSPPQFSAWFSSDKYSDATVPATAQYKVFYHIFAGKNRGVSYQVYLKSPPESPYYTTAQTVTVVSDFIGQGEYASDTRDFTAPEGYRELCVRIDNEDRCGFGQVSTSYAVNYLTDQYASGQAKETERITSASDCVSGTAGLAPSANPQALLQESVFPNVYSRGIVRICSTRNPAESTDPIRYVDVGYCDNQQTRCWLDKESVSNAITDRGIENKTISTLEQTQKSKLEEGGYVLTDDKSEAALKALADEEGRLADSVSPTDEKAQNILTNANNLEPQMFLNHHKAKLLLIKAKVLGKIAGFSRPERPYVIAEGLPVITSVVVGSVVVGKQVTVSAIIKDDIKVDRAALMYRIYGKGDFTPIFMTNVGDKYSAAIPASSVTTDGIEYSLWAEDNDKNVGSWPSQPKGYSYEHIEIGEEGHGLSLSGSYDGVSTINVLNDEKETQYYLVGSAIKRRITSGEISSNDIVVGRVVNSVIRITSTNINGVKNELGVDISNAQINGNKITLE